MRIPGRILLAIARLRNAQLDRRCADPRPLQTAQLMRSVRYAERTRFGREHGFDSIDTVAEYQKRVPLRKYDAFQPYIARAMKGEANVLWPGRTRYFGMSGGTTGGNKYLPISRETIRRQQRGGFDPLASYLKWSDDGAILGGYAIMLGGTSTLATLDSGAKVGDNTGIMANHMPWIARRMYRPSPRTRAITDWDAKISQLVRESIEDDVRLIAGTPSWFPGLFDRLIQEAHRRGRQASSVLDLWPNLRLLTGGGVNYQPYRPLIETRLGREIAYVDVYNATEGGIMGVQDRPDDLAMRLIPDAGVFYEFIPIDAIDSEPSPRLPMWEVKPNQVYALVVSNASGLWSYVIGDCLKFVDCFPHRFVFEGRIGGFLNVTGEHVSQGELDRAMQRACDAFKVRVRDYSVTTEVGAGDSHGTRHVYLVEFDGSIPELEPFSRTIDDDLKAYNGDYAAHRSSPLGLIEPVVRSLQNGAFDRWMKSRGKLGGQNKVPRVLGDPDLKSGLEVFALLPASSN